MMLVFSYAPYALAEGMHLSGELKSELTMVMSNNVISGNMLPRQYCTIGKFRDMNTVQGHWSPPNIAVAPPFHY